MPRAANLTGAAASGAGSSSRLMPSSAKCPASIAAANGPVAAHRNQSVISLMSWTSAGPSQGWAAAAAAAASAAAASSAAAAAAASSASAAAAAAASSAASASAAGRSRLSLGIRRGRLSGLQLLLESGHDLPGLRCLPQQPRRPQRLRPRPSLPPKRPPHRPPCPRHRLPRPPPRPRRPWPASRAAVSTTGASVGRVVAAAGRDEREHHYEYRQPLNNRLSHV